jgi:hypothetical protein
MTPNQKTGIDGRIRTMKLRIDLFDAPRFLAIPRRVPRKKSVLKRKNIKASPSPTARTLRTNNITAMTGENRTRYETSLIRPLLDLKESQKKTPRPNR